MYVKRVAGAAFAAALGMSGLAVGAGVADAAPMKPAPTYTGFGPIADAPPGPPGPGPGPGPGGPGPGGPGGSGGAHGPGGPGGPGAWWTWSWWAGGIGWSSWTRRSRWSAPLDLLLVVLHLPDRVELGPVDRELPDLMGRVDLGDLASRVVLVAMDLAAPVDLVHGPGGPADRVELTSRVGPADRVELTGRAVPVDPVAPAAPDLTGRRTWRAGRSRWTATAAVRPTRFLRPGWPPDGRPQGRAARVQRAGSRGAASAPGTRIRLERWASPRRSAAFLGRTTASRWLGRASASRWLEQPMERAGARCRNRAA